MTSRAGTLAAVAACVLLAVLAWSLLDHSALAASNVYRIGSSQDAGRVTVPVGKSKTIRVDADFGQVVVGADEIADVVPLSSRSAYVLGKKIGSTNLTFYDSNKQLIAVLDVEVSYDLKELQARLKENIPYGNIRASSINGRVLLRGTVPSADALKTAMLIAEQYAPESVTSTLKVAAPQQVMLEVRFIEAFRSAGRELGLQWDMFNNGVIGKDTLISNTLPFGVIIGEILDNGFKVDLLVRALEEKGLARRLAEPNLVALSGDTASFLAGGEFPFPVAAENDRITIEFKRFGVGLAFTPTVLADRVINLKIEPEVSQLDPTSTVEVNNVRIPSLIVRRAKTTVELRDGQSFAIAGLLQNVHTSNVEQLPWLGSVPVLGALFRSTSYQKEQTDLVIIITPRLVQPAKPGQRFATPLDDTVPANDKDLFLMGRQELPREMQDEIETGGSIKGPFGHIIELE